MDVNSTDTEATVTVCITVSVWIVAGSGIDQPPWPEYTVDLGHVWSPIIYKTHLLSYIVNIRAVGRTCSDLGMTLKSALQDLIACTAVNTTEQRNLAMIGCKVAFYTLLPFTIILFPYILLAVFWTKSVDLLVVRGFRSMHFHLCYGLKFLGTEKSELVTRPALNVQVVTWSGISASSTMRHVGTSVGHVPVLEIQWDSSQSMTTCSL